MASPSYAKRVNRWVENTKITALGVIDIVFTSVNGVLLHFFWMMDAGKLSHRASLYLGLYMSYRATEWCLTFAEAHTSDAPGTAAIIGAVSVPVMAMTAALFKFYSTGTATISAPKTPLASSQASPPEPDENE